MLLNRCSRSCRRPDKIRGHEHSAIDAGLFVYPVKRLRGGVQEAGNSHGHAELLRSRYPLQRPASSPQDTFHPGIGDGYEAVGARGACREPRVNRE